MRRIQTGSQVRVPPRQHKRASSFDKFLDFVCFIIPLANFYVFKIIGSLPGGEILTLVLLIPCFMYFRGRIWRGYNKPIFVLMGLWLLSTIVSDLYNHTSFDNSARGAALVAFFGIDLVVLSALAYKRHRRILFYAIGDVLGTALNYFLFATENRGEWKFGISPFVIPAVVLLSCYFYNRRLYSVTAVMLMGLAGVNLWQNFRSPFLFLVIVSVLVLPFSNWTRRRVGVLPILETRVTSTVTLRSSMNGPTIIMAILIVISAYAVSKTYAYMASSGNLGDDAQIKYLAQSKGKFGLLAGGRPESLISWRAALDRPFLGHGSQAEDPKYVEMLMDIQAETGYADDSQQDAPAGEAPFLIPTHSHLMSAWVFSGILGGIFWIYILYLVALTILKLANYHPPLAPYFAYVAILSLWNIVFSPFGQGARMESAIGIVVLCSCLEVDPTQKADGKARNRIDSTRGQRAGGIVSRIPQLRRR